MVGGSLVITMLHVPDVLLNALLEYLDLFINHYREAKELKQAHLAFLSLCKQVRL